MNYNFSIDREIAEILNCFKPLLGKWSGRGRGRYPTIDSFEYEEELRFVQDSERALIHYEQMTHLAGNGQPEHWESGFIRVLDNGSVELSNSQNSGRVEVLSGAITAQDSFCLELSSVHFGNDPRMVQTHRKYVVIDDQLNYQIAMATNTTEKPLLQNHLKAELQRVS